MPDDVTPATIMPDAPNLDNPHLNTPTRSLRASAKSTNPQARMQELLRRDIPHQHQEDSLETPELGRNEEMKERNNEASFTVSEIVSDEESKDTSEMVSQIATKLPMEQPPKHSRNPPTKQHASKTSLKAIVLEEDTEERVNKTRLNVDIDEDLHFWLKGHALQNRRKLNDLIPRILKAYRDQVEGD